MTPERKEYVMIPECYESCHTREFWLELGMDYIAADNAAKCFPGNANHYNRWALGTPEERARKAAQSVSQEYLSDPEHPAFWYAQGYDFDEMVRRAVAAIAMVRLQQEAAPPKPRDDGFVDAVRALLMQACASPEPPPRPQLPAPSPERSRTDAALPLGGDNLALSPDCKRTYENGDPDSDEMAKNTDSQMQVCSATSANRQGQTCHNWWPLSSARRYLECVVLQAKSPLRSHRPRRRFLPNYGVLR